jgi:hypothetical protein
MTHLIVSIALAMVLAGCATWVRVCQGRWRPPC